MDYSSDSSSNYSNVSTEKSSGSSQDSIKSSPKTLSVQKGYESLSAPKVRYNILSSTDSKTNYPRTSDTVEILDTESVSSVRNETTPNIGTVKHNQRNTHFKETIVKTQYEIYNIMRGVNFCKHFIQKCRGIDVCGYIVFFHRRRSAFGEMEGTVEAINEVKNYLYSSCLPEPFTKRAKFSTYEIEHFPKRIQFTRAYIINKSEECKGNKKKIGLRIGDSGTMEPETVGEIRLSFESVSLEG